MLARIRTMQAQKADEGASAVEYALLVAAIAALIVIVVFAFGGLIKDIFSDTCTTIDTTTSSTGTAVLTPVLAERRGRPGLVGPSSRRDVQDSAFWSTRTSSPRTGPRGASDHRLRETHMLTRIRTIKAQRTDDGASAVEYALLVAAIAALIVIVVFAFGGLINDIFKDTCDSIGTGSGVAETC